MLKREWETRSDSNGEGRSVSDDGENRSDPKDALDSKLIREKSLREDRKKLRKTFLLNLPGNDASKEQG